MNNFKILVIEDDPPIRNLITTTLEAHDYKYLTAANGKEAVLEMTSHNPDILLLDLGLPDMDGVDIIKKIRTWSQVPILVISARNEDSDKIEALDAGADDYLTKPFSIDELLARLRVTQRRILAMQGQNGKTENTIFTNGLLKIDYFSGCVFWGEEELHLTPIEFKLLDILAKNIGKVLTYNYLTTRIWGHSQESDHASLRVFMANLRKKLGSKNNPEPMIQTHIGIGYRMIRC